MITAHSGALNTGRNSRQFLDTVKDYKVEVIEVDVRKKGGLLYIKHTPAFFNLKKCITLKEIFEFIKTYDYKVNCDIKEKGIIRDVISLAKEMDVADRLIFTGSVMQKDIYDLDCGTVYVNKLFYKPLKPTLDNLEIIKTLLEGFENEHIGGLNLPYSYATKGFLLRCMELDLKLSLYTVDDVSELDRLLDYNPDNITTNLIKDALELKDKKSKNLIKEKE
jgi:hypothetical protein